MSRTEERFISVCNELKLYTQTSNKAAFGVAFAEFDRAVDQLGIDRALELIRGVNSKWHTITYL